MVAERSSAASVASCWKPPVKHRRSRCHRMLLQMQQHDFPAPAAASDGPRK